MREGKIKDIIYIYNAEEIELKILVDGKIERYVLKKDFVKFDKLQKDTVINWEEEAGNITKIIANGEEIYNNTSVNRGER